MTKYQLTWRPTSEEHDEHTARMRGIAHAIADKLDAGEALSDTEAALVTFILGEAASVREWARSYSTKKDAHRPPEFAHTDAAIAYALERERGATHYKATLIVGHAFGVTKRALQRAIWPLLPNVCAHLRIDPAKVIWRATPPP